MLILLGQTFWNENRPWYLVNHQLHKILVCTWKNMVCKQKMAFSLIFICFFFSSTHQIITSSVDWIIFATIYLPFNLFNIIWYSTNLEVHSVLSRFFSRTSKILMKLDVFFWKFIVAKCFYYLFIFYETFVMFVRRKLLHSLTIYL